MSSRIAPSGRGTRWRSSQLISGAATAAITPAAITGTTITFVSASSQTDPTRNSPTPTSSHAVKPTSRSQRGAARTPVSAAASMLMYSSAGRSPLRVARRGG